VVRKGVRSRRRERAGVGVGRCGLRRAVRVRVSAVRAGRRALRSAVGLLRGMRRVRRRRAEGGRARNGTAVRDGARRPCPQGSSRRQPRARSGAESTCRGVARSPEALRRWLNAETLLRGRGDRSRRPPRSRRGERLVALAPRSRLLRRWCRRRRCRALVAVLVAVAERESASSSPSRARIVERRTHLDSGRRMRSLRPCCAKERESSVDSAGETERESRVS